MASDDRAAYTPFSCLPKLFPWLLSFAFYLFVCFKEPDSNPWKGSRRTEGRSRKAREEAVAAVLLSAILPQTETAEAGQPKPPDLGLVPL